VRIVDEQMKDVETQMQALDDFVTRARSQNAQHHDNHAQSLQSLSTTVKSSYDNIGSHFNTTYERVRDLGDEMSIKTNLLQETLAPLDSVLRQPLADLRSNIETAEFQEYNPTGATPQKVQYQFPTELPKTDAHDQLLAALRRPMNTDSKSHSKSTTIPVVFNDAVEGVVTENTTLPLIGLDLSASMSEGRRATSGGLREVDLNVTSRSLNIDLQSSMVSLSDVSKDTRELFRKSVTGAGKLPVLKSKKSTSSILPAEGRENVNILAQSTGRRRSPRTA
jgi:kinesin family member 11